jgi:hypothetical protein
MSSKGAFMYKKKEKFRDIWVNQSILGREFNMSAVAIGKKLKELGLRQADATPTEKAFAENFCISTPLKDGTPFYLWHKAKVRALLQSTGIQPANPQELRCREFAENIIRAERLSDEGQDKLAYVFYGEFSHEIRRADVPLINLFLKESGTRHRLSENDFPYP